MIHDPGEAAININQVIHINSCFRRIDDGDRLCKDLILLVQERANIEKEFAKQLKAWSTKWNSLIEKGNYLISCL